MVVIAQRLSLGKNRNGLGADAQSNAGRPGEFMQSRGDAALGWIVHGVNRATLDCDRRLLKDADSRGMDELAAFF